MATFKCACLVGEKHSKEKKSELRILLKKGIIGMMARQVEYALHVNGEPVASYVADFQYIETETGKTVVEDVKSEITRKLAIYRLKKKLMRQIHGIIIKEY